MQDVHEVAAAPSPLGARVACNHVCLSVADLERCVRWYADVLGLRCVRRFAIPEASATFALLQADGGGPMIELVNVPGTGPNPTANGGPAEAGSIQGFAHLAFEVADCDQTVSVLRARGAQIVAEPRDAPDAGMRCAFFLDVEGNLLELVQSI